MVLPESLKKAKTTHTNKKSQHKLHLEAFKNFRTQIKKCHKLNQNFVLCKTKTEELNFYSSGKTLS